MRSDEGKDNNSEDRTNTAHFRQCSQSCETFSFAPTELRKGHGRPNLIFHRRNNGGSENNLIGR